MCFTDITISYERCEHKSKRTVICSDVACPSNQQTYITLTEPGPCTDCTQAQRQRSSNQPKSLLRHRIELIISSLAILFFLLVWLVLISKLIHTISTDEAEMRRAERERHDAAMKALFPFPYWLDHYNKKPNLILEQHNEAVKRDYWYSVSKNILWAMKCLAAMLGLEPPPPRR